MSNESFLAENESCGFIGQVSMGPGDTKITIAPCADKPPVRLLFEVKKISENHQACQIIIEGIPERAAISTLLHEIADSIVQNDTEDEEEVTNKRGQLAFIEEIQPGGVVDISPAVARSFQRWSEGQQYAFDRIAQTGTGASNSQSDAPVNPPVVRDESSPMSNRQAEDRVHRVGERDARQVANYMVAFANNRLESLRAQGVNPSPLEETDNG